MNNSGKVCSEATSHTESQFSPCSLAVGIDLEDAENLPWPADPRTEPFYADNFTSAEIAYCIRQQDPRLSFCGLWSAKEAASKCGCIFAGLRPIDLEIQYEGLGHPVLRVSAIAGETRKSNCRLSISHSGTICMATCICGPTCDKR